MQATINLYTIEELREQHPDTYSELYQEYRDEAAQWDLPWATETVDSLKAFIEALNFKICDYCFSTYRSYFTVHSGYDPAADIEDLCNARAYAHIMNCLEAYRIPYGCKHKKYKNYMRYGSCYRAGKILPAPFTGFYTDDIYIEKTIDYVLKHGTLKEAIESLAGTITKILEEDYEQQLSEESFESWCDDDLYTSKGTKLTEQELELQPC
jgi:hypothetical protein